ncbi:hypothetical protein D3C87_504540 [compost metagenome]
MTENRRIMYFFPHLSTVDRAKSRVRFVPVEDLDKALVSIPGEKTRLIARMMFIGDKPPTIVPGVWGYCDCHGWTHDPEAIPNDFGQMEIQEG